MLSTSGRLAFDRNAFMLIFICSERNTTMKVAPTQKTISHNDLQYVMLILTESWKIIQN